MYVHVCVCVRVGEESSSTASSSSGSADDVVQAPVAHDWLATLLGCKLRFEDRTHASGHYARLIITCPHHDDCHKRRNVGRRQCLNYGRREPLAFLAAWVQSGPVCHNAAQHRTHVPTLEQQRAWLAA